THTAGVAEPPAHAADVVEPPAHAAAAKASSNAGAQPSAHRHPNGITARRVLQVIVPRGEDDNACVRVLEQLHVLVDRFPGSDEIRLVLLDRSGGHIELAGADILVRHTPDLESQMRSLVGADNLVVVS
ncbi:MAG: hypothetical protein M3069_15950, partial [Chloroflexota bacterium]|nr:hypothetical protein [Chloroflexota bacterium]